MEFVTPRADFFRVIHNEPIALSEGQFRAAQMFIARLLAEGEGRVFDFEDVGLNWELSDSTTCAHYDDGTELTVGDVMYGAIMLVWSTIVDRAEIAGETVLESLSRLGLGLALYDPT